MKIIAEFNSTEELLGFIDTFGTKAVQLQGEDEGPKKEYMKADKKPNLNKVEEVTKPEKKVEEITTQNNKEIPNVEAEEVGQDVEITEIKDVEVEGVKVTKEQVREVFSKLVKSGKQKEAKELTGKYGASKISEVKEKDYAAILKDAEELL